MPNVAPGEVWLVDLGMTAKIRPCLILSDYPAEDGELTRAEYVAIATKLIKLLNLTGPVALRT